MKKMNLVFLSSLLLGGSVYASSLSKIANEDSLIVYNGNIGLVHEQRNLTLGADEGTIVYEGVANSIEIDSVNVSLPRDINLKSQQYRFDKLTQSKLLEAHIGKNIEVRLPKDDQSFIIINARLLSSENTKSLVQASDGNIITVDSDAIIFREIPEELITKASLVWNVEAKNDVNAAMKIDYLINNISWQSNYILNLTKDEASLDGWISIDNRSGKAYEDVDLHVLAGDINRAAQAPVQYKQVRAMAMMEDSSNVTHQAHEGYHFYTVPFKVSIANNEKTQIKFINKTNIPVQRKYSAMLSDPSYFNTQVEHTLTQSLTLSPLDIALPKGVVRTYSQLGNTNILLGESNLEHTPKESLINLEIGKSFDLKVIESIESRDDDQYRLNATMKYTLKNNSNEPKTLELLVPFNKDDNSKVKTDQNFTYTKGNLVTFSVAVDAMSTKEFIVNFISQK
jgi:hypothetical protein